MDETRPEDVALYAGVVTDNTDPLKIGRVKLRIPGHIEGESEWAFPMGLPGAGETRLGFFSVPKEGAEVGVWFLQGNKARPCYVAGHWGAPGGASQAPTPVQEVEPKDAHLIRCLETESYLLTFDDRPDHRSVELRDKLSGDGITLHGAQRAMEIKATTAIRIKALGAVSIEGVTVTINGRAVLPGSSPIK